MRPEIICSLRYRAGIKCLSCKVMMMCWKYGLLLILRLCSGGGSGARRHRSHTEALRADIPNVTWNESMTHFTSGGFALCDKGSKNVNTFSACKSGLLSEDCCRKDLPCWQVFVSWQKRAQREILCGGGGFWFDVRLSSTWRNVSLFFFNFQPWNNF